MFSLAVEAIGMVAAASTVRMVAGKLAGAAAFVVMLTDRGFHAGSPMVLPAALLILLLSTVGATNLWRQAGLAAGCLFVCSLVARESLCMVPVATASFLMQSLSRAWGDWPHKAHGRWAAAVLVVAPLAGCALMSCALMMSGADGLAFRRVSGAVLVLATIALLWLAVGLREGDGVVVALAGIPLICCVVDQNAGRPLLWCTAVSLLGLVRKSYLMKRAAD